MHSARQCHSSQPPTAASNQVPGTDNAPPCSLDAKAHGHAPAAVVFGSHRARVCLGYRADDGQPEAGTPGIAVPSSGSGARGPRHRRMLVGVPGGNPVPESGRLDSSPHPVVHGRLDLVDASTFWRERRALSSRLSSACRTRSRVDRDHHILDARPDLDVARSSSEPDRLDGRLDQLLVQARPDRRSEGHAASAGSAAQDEQVASVRRWRDAMSSASTLRSARSARRESEGGRVPARPRHACWRAASGAHGSHHRRGGARVRARRSRRSSIALRVIASRASSSPVAGTGRRRRGRTPRFGGRLPPHASTGRSAAPASNQPTMDVATDTTPPATTITTSSRRSASSVSPRLVPTTTIRRCPSRSDRQRHEPDRLIEAGRGPRERHGRSSAATTAGSRSGPHRTMGVASSNAPSAPRTWANDSSGSTSAPVATTSSCSACTPTASATAWGSVTEDAASHRRQRVPLVRSSTTAAQREADRDHHPAKAATGALRTGKRSQRPISSRGRVRSPARLPATRGSRYSCTGPSSPQAIADHREQSLIIVRSDRTGGASSTLAPAEPDIDFHDVRVTVATREVPDVLEQVGASASHARRASRS